MDELKTEEEQLEAFRAWWKEYGNYVIGGVVLGGLVLFGINYQGNTRLEAQQAASALYDQLTDEVVDGDLDAAEALAAQIANDYSNTAYVVQSKLAMARLYMDENRDEDAANTLRELIALKGVDEIREIARLRLAKVLIYQEKAEEALETVSEAATGAFAARFAEVRGDAHVQLENFEEARAAYDEALQQPNSQQTLDVGYVRLKLLDLPPPAIAAAGTAEVESEIADAAQDASEAEEAVEEASDVAEAADEADDANETTEEASE
ncbi:MAG: tetratricopeptide repeat protein [Woeseiaceae bacterium]|nr:tetratricopeptide repeat protein [Woeseiaceae bacterium]